MARISRKRANEVDSSRDNKGCVLETEKAKTYNVAVYTRLSIEDNGGDNKNSIETQKTMILNFVSEKPDFKIHKIYCDNGKTGINFERPAFKEMMEDIKLGKVNCIIVKDLSRFGRNFEETGRYIEQILPFMNVRFIAINDNYDSIDSKKNEGLIVALKNLINAAYSKDISKKVRSQIDIHKKKGYFAAGHVPYGYLKDADNKYRLVVDDETALVVKQIFNWRIEGKSYCKIAEQLNKNGVWSSRRRLWERGISKEEKYKNVLWAERAISDMLKNRIYIGHIERGKFKVIECGSKKVKMVDPEDWYITENAHEAIITNEVFEEVQRVNLNRRKKYENEPKYLNIDKILKGLVTCGHCGAKAKVINVINKKTKEHTNRIYCVSRYTKGKDACMPNSISEKELEKVVSSVIEKQIVVATRMEILLRDLQSANKKKNINNTDSMLKRELSKELTRIRNYRTSLYEEYKTNTMSRAEYLELMGVYDEKERNAIKSMEELEKRKEKEEEIYSGAEKCIEMLKGYKGSEMFTRNLAETLVEKIILYSGKRVEIKLKCEDVFKEVETYMQNEMRCTNAR